MRRYLIKRILLMIPMLIGITLISYILINLAPGDPATMYVDYEKGPPTPAQLAEIRAKMGLDKPLLIRYLLWLKGIATGNLGYSYRTHKPIITEIGSRIGATITLSLLSMVLSTVLGIIVGVICALRQYKFTDYLLSVLSFIFLSIPSFWLGMMMIYLFTNKLGWLPSVGLRDVYLIDPTPWERFIDYVRHLIMPVIALSIGSIGSWARYQRATFLEVIGQDFIRTARSKGLSERVIDIKHAMRNSCLPIITLVSMSLPGLIGGAFIIESIFGLPGMGRFGLDAITSRDYPVIMATTLFSSILVMLGAFLADVLYAVIDPRIRYN